MTARPRGSSGPSRRVGEPWERLGVVIDAGFSGETDSYGVESPCVVDTPGGYLMAYGGFDGEVTRLHMASSPDGRRWIPQGTIIQRGLKTLAPPPTPASC